MNFNFLEIAYDVMGGTILGAIGYVVEFTLAGYAPITATHPALYGGIVGAALFAGAIFGKVGSKAAKAAEAQ